MYGAYIRIDKQEQYKDGIEHYEVTHREDAVEVASVFPLFRTHLSAFLLQDLI